MSAGDDYAAEIIRSLAGGTSRAATREPPEPEPGSPHGEYFKAVDDELLQTVAYRVALFLAWREAGGLTAGDLYSMAYNEPARHRQSGVQLGWRSYLNCAALREITRARQAGPQSSART